MARSVDTKLARRLQKRNVWPNYTACLREVQKLLRSSFDSTLKELEAAIDRGELDPPKP